MKKIILSLAAVAFCSTLSFGQLSPNAFSEYTAALDGYDYVGNWQDCINQRAIVGTDAALSYPGDSLTITCAGDGVGYSHSATYIPMISKAGIVYNPGSTDCTGALPATMDISGLPVAEQKVIVILKSSAAVTLRLYVAQGQNGGNIWSNNNTATTDISVPAGKIDTISLDLSVSANLASTNAGGNVPLTALTYVGFNPNVATGNFTGTISILKIGVGNSVLYNAIKAATTTATLAAVNNSLISVYPNPAKDQITIDLSSLNAANALVKITNSNGAVVYQETASNSTQIINTSSFNKGIYMVQVSSDNNVSNKKVVIE
jgi:hypothetical protein